ncbi:unnamed protein product [Durusdinium trenchii]|uniref:Endoplasmic reticulum vesicle transporter N-terminal domain-containing protein n=2 Tax=Durusdinium trenchii TaxID=1381693 RepID=A0ABP0IFJ4_9DINO
MCETHRSAATLRPSHRAMRPSAGTTSVKRFDLYGKVHDDYRIKTQSGGIISLVSMLIMAVLFLSELSSYLRADILDHIVVDTSLNQKLPIGLNITFPHLRCDEVSVDTVDSKGENQVDIAGTLTKVNLDLAGAVSKGDPVAKPGECFSCLEAVDPGDAEKQPWTLGTPKKRLRVGG